MESFGFMYAELDVSRRVSVSIAIKIAIKKQ